MVFAMLNLDSWFKFLVKFGISVLCLQVNKGRSCFDFLPCEPRRWCSTPGVGTVVCEGASPLLLHTWCCALCRSQAAGIQKSCKALIPGMLRVCLNALLLLWRAEQRYSFRLSTDLLAVESQLGWAGRKLKDKASVPAACSEAIWFKTIHKISALERVVFATRW